MSEPLKPEWIEAAINSLEAGVMPYDYDTDAFNPEYIDHMRAQGLPLYKVSNESLFMILARIEERLKRIEDSG